MHIPFNKPYLAGNELKYISEAVKRGRISGNGDFTKRCQSFFEDKYGFKKTLLTTSCTDALEMIAILLNLTEGDEVIVPSYTFVSTALAFERQGASVVFCDSKKDFPGMDENKVEALITEKTKAIVAVHYAGVACEMDVLKNIADKYNLFLVEDAAQAIESTYKGQYLGSLGDLGCFSFHETKNIQCGEGGLLIINDEKYFDRAEIIWEKGTNRTRFFRGEIDKYGWVDIGSSFLPSDMNAAFLLAQLENIEEIQKKRINIWEQYYQELAPLARKGFIQLPLIPDYAHNNGHMFYIICRSLDERSKLINYLKRNDVSPAFHYLALHNSQYYLRKYKQKIKLPYAEMFSERLLRLPFYYELTSGQINHITGLIKKFYLS